MLANVALLVVSLLLALGAAECAVRAKLVPQPSFVASDAWWQDNWYRQRRGPNPREFVHLDPDLGWIPAAGLDDLDYQRARISTNSAHMRGRREYSLTPGAGSRIVAVGDSYTFGQCIGDDGTWPAVLEASLPGSEVLNLGVMGYGHDQAMLRMRRDGLPYRPDVVVFGFHATDMRRNGLSFRDYGKPRFRLGPDGLSLENVPVPPPEFYDARIWPPRLWNHVLIWRDVRRMRDRRELKRENSRVTVAIVEQAAREARAAGARFVLLHLPKPSALENQKNRFGWRWLERLCEKLEAEGARCIDPTPRFREIVRTEQDVAEHFDCHYSPTLYRALGEVSAAALLEAYPDLSR